MRPRPAVAAARVESTFLMTFLLSRSAPCREAPLGCGAAFTAQRGLWSSEVPGGGDAPAGRSPRRQPTPQAGDGSPPRLTLFGARMPLFYDQRPPPPVR